MRQKANTKTSPVMKISSNVKQGTSLLRILHKQLKSKKKQIKKAISRKKYT